MNYKIFVSPYWAAQTDPETKPELKLKVKVEGFLNRLNRTWGQIAFRSEFLISETKTGTIMTPIPPADDFRTLPDILHERILQCATMYFGGHKEQLLCSWILNAA